ncbi:efflux transporter outer membrane subunit [Acetobacter musti]|uniref:Efflux transporter outer membrane subunit n=1 Tax=Acetobacter musti TaxID=864732 RepID=A0ABX0JQ48_9PROT|nr:efflux transporter outer membrane subunit [Acetobacter musti]NHN84228.1 efflux transporter outer membrane subunit [Acetobacter musti]
MIRPRFRLAPLLLAPLLLARCAWLAPDYKRPSLPLPDRWNGAAAVARDDSEWWHSYNDPVLDQLIADALKDSDDIALAKNRLSQARAQYGYAFANQLPAISVVGADAYGQVHLNESLPIPQKMSNLGFVGGMLTYEVDLWGKNASLSNAAKAGVRAAACAEDAARLSVSAGTAKLYFSLRALDAEVAILEDAVRTQDELLALVQRQYDVGAVDALLFQAATERRDTAHAALPDARDQRDRAESALAVLAGHSPKDIAQNDISRGRDLYDLTIPEPAPSVMPSQLIERRPDIAMHEQMLIASNFNIGHARAAYFPSLSLATLAGVNNIDLNNLYRATTRSWALPAAMAAPVLDFGRTESGVKLARAAKNEQVVLYQQSIRTAFKEVRDALLAENTAADRDNSDTEREKAAETRLHLTTLRQAEGWSSRIDVLAARSTLEQEQLTRVAARLQRLDASVDLYKATGGGFRMSR